MRVVKYVNLRMRNRYNIHIISYCNILSVNKLRIILLVNVPICLNNLGMFFIVFARVALGASALLKFYNTSSPQDKVIIYVKTASMWATDTQLQVPLHLSKHMTTPTQMYWSQLSCFPYLKRREWN